MIRSYFREELLRSKLFRVLENPTIDFFLELGQLGVGDVLVKVPRKHFLVFDSALANDVHNVAFIMRLDGNLNTAEKLTGTTIRSTGEVIPINRATPSPITKYGFVVESREVISKFLQTLFNVVR